MDAESPIPPSRQTTSPDLYAELLTWGPIVAGLAFLYAPSLIGLFRGIWSTPEQGHGPMVLAVSLWLIYRQWPEMLLAAREKSPCVWGWPILVIGLLLYTVGRSQDILLFEIGSVIWVLIAIVLLLFGAGALKAQWFPLFFMFFMIPLPGPIIDAVTMPMKMAVSYMADQILFAAGYPIARSGVVLQIGQYKLLVADACAGLHTLFSLEAMGLLYLNLVRHDSWFRNVLLAILIVPISFTANVIRVMTLTLITYYWGDEAGQGFLHGFAGMVLFLSALLLIIGVDSLLQATVHFRRKIRTRGVKVSGPAKVDRP
jgi:exosortase B